MKIIWASVATFTAKAYSSVAQKAQQARFVDAELENFPAVELDHGNFVVVGGEG
jgi:hypothetical protein